MQLFTISNKWQLILRNVLQKKEFLFFTVCFWHIYHSKTTWFMCEICKFNLRILLVQYMYDIKYKNNNHVSTTWSPNKFGKDVLQTVYLVVQVSQFFVLDLLKTSNHNYLGLLIFKKVCLWTNTLIHFPPLK